MKTLLTHRFQQDTSLPVALVVRGFPAAAGVSTGSAKLESSPVNAGAGTEEVRPIGRAETPPQGIKFVQLVVLPLLVCVLLVVFLRRYVLN
jgi:hypothetical protein